MDISNAELYKYIKELQREFTILEDRLNNIEIKIYGKKSET